MPVGLIRPHTTCINGHEYASTNETFKRDSKGIAFKGEGQSSAPTYVRLFCRKCGVTHEIQSIPELHLRPSKIDPRKQPIYAGVKV